MNTQSRLTGQSDAGLSQKSGENAEILFSQLNNISTMTSATFLFCVTCLFIGELGKLCFCGSSLGYIEMLHVIAFDICVVIL